MESAQQRRSLFKRVSQLRQDRPSGGALEQWRRRKQTEKGRARPRRIVSVGIVEHYGIVGK